MAGRTLPDACSAAHRRRRVASPKEGLAALGDLAVSVFCTAVAVFRAALVVRAPAHAWSAAQKGLRRIATPEGDLAPLFEFAIGLCVAAVSPLRAAEVVLARTGSCTARTVSIVWLANAESRLTSEAAVFLCASAVPPLRAAQSVGTRADARAAVVALLEGALGQDGAEDAQVGEK